MINALDEHYGYLCDRVKLERFQAAIECAVQPGDVVMDLGCGSGLLGLMALRAGAGRVLFVEEGAIIEVARRTVAESGFAERSSFFHLNSYELDLPEPVDVILCDHVGYLGFDYGILALLADAKRRFLKEEGVIVPAEIDLTLAPVETASGRDRVGRWRDGSVPEDFAWIATPAANNKLAVDVKKEDLLGKPAVLAEFHLGSEAEAFYGWDVEVQCARDGTLDGLLGWFDCRLHADIRMTNSPIAGDHVNRPQAFLPLEKPATVRAGETIRATVMARPSDRILAWTVGLPEQDKKFSLTTFDGLLLDDQALNRTRPDRIARLSDRGRAHLVVLSYCDGERTVGEVEALVRQEHPRLFPTNHAAEKLVRQVLVRDIDA